MIVLHVMRWPFIKYTNLQVIMMWKNLANKKTNMLTYSGSEDDNGYMAGTCIFLNIYIYIYL